MLSIADHVRADFAQLDAYELVGKPTSALLGVSKPAEAALKHVGISTVFDLGASWLFANARAASEADREGTASSRFGRAPTDWLQTDVQYGSLAEISALPVQSLRGVSGDDAAALTQALDVRTIRDLAHWPPYAVARRLVGNVAGGTGDPDLVQSEALRPRFGEYPTERVYYSTLVMLHTGAEGKPQGVLNAPLSVMPAIEHQHGPGKLAIGALLTLSQSWYAQGITLGHLLHSLALAPGEATRLAVVDWSRRSRASDTEAVGEQEGLDNAMDHGRAISEVQNAVASEMQSGGSHTHATSKSKSSSMQASASTGLLTSLVASGDVSGTTETASTEADATSSSWSMGNRSVLGQMAQQVNDRTEQHATSVRNRRASAVSEVGDAGHNQVSTRIVANYNHMHALTVQYYETVQLYRVATQLHRAERCLFVPMEQLDFSGAHGMELVERFRGALVRSALNRRAAELLLDRTTAVAITPALPVKVPMLRPRVAVHRAPPPHAAPATSIFAPLAAALEVAKAHPAAERSTLNVFHLALEVASKAHGAGHPVLFEPLEAALHAAKSHPAAERGSLNLLEVLLGSVKAHHAPAHPTAARGATHAPAPAAHHAWHDRDISHIARLIARPIVRPGSHALHLPEDTEVHGIAFSDVHVRSVAIGHAGKRPDHVVHVPANGTEIDLHPPRSLAELSAISLVKQDQAAASGTMTLHLSRLGRQFSSPPVAVSLPAGTAAHHVVTFHSESEDRKKELLAHLRANRVHYSQAVFRSLDPATIVTLLAQHTWNGRPLADQVEPRPLAVSGNYLVLRAPVEATETSSVKASGKELTWGELLHARGLELGQGDQRLVPIPTSGVYAEAVLGRSNSAEKLDITRFWNWQDSPIPLAPPEIAPVSAAMPTTSLEAKPEALGAPVLSMMTPTALPAPAGLGTALSAIANPNLFRDMSGLAGTQALARTGMSETLMGATDAAQVASANMRTEAQKAVAMGQIAADVAKAAYTHQQSNSKIQDISGEGARINHGADMDRRGVPGPTGLQPYTVASGQAGNGSAQAAGKGGGKVGGAARGYSHETTQRTAGMPVGGFGSSARSPGAATAQPGSSSQGTLPRAANGGASIAPPSDAGSADPADGGSLPPFMTTYRVDDAALLAHLTEALRYAPFIRACADRSQVPVSIIAALGSRVSGWGLDLTPPGPAGIGARSRLGLMQVDPSGAAASTSWTDPATNIALGCNALIQNLGDVLRRFSLADRQVLRAGLAAYDAGIDAVARVIAAGSDAFDSVTTGGNFSDDVLDRAGWFEARGFGRQMAMREVLA